MKLAALLFEVEGVLVESEDLHRRAFNEAFREFGVPWYWDEVQYRKLLSISGGPERLRHYIGQADPAVLERADFSSFTDAMHKAKNQAYAEMIAEGGLTFRPGIARLAKKARHEGLRLAATTAMTEENVETVFTRGNAPLRDLFTVIGHGECVKAKKPAPDIYVWMLNELRLPASACLALEGSSRGVTAAAAAAIPAVVTVSDYTLNEDYDSAVAVISDLGEEKRPFRLLAGQSFGREYVDVELLHLWHRAARPQILPTEKH